ncbi:MAG: hypothetical protein ABW213_12315 [Tardiphaga sp.]
MTAVSVFASAADAPNRTAAATAVDSSLINLDPRNVSVMDALSCRGIIRQRGEPAAGIQQKSCHDIVEAPGTASNAMRNHSQKALRQMQRRSLQRQIRTLQPARCGSGCSARPWPKRQRRMLTKHAGAEGARREIQPVDPAELPVDRVERFCNLLRIGTVGADGQGPASRLSRSPQP